MSNFLPEQVVIVGGKTFMLKLKENNEQGPFIIYGFVKGTETPITPNNPNYRKVESCLNIKLKS